MDADGKAIEHWDALQLVGNPKDSAPLIAPNILRANPNGMFSPTDGSRVAFAVKAGALLIAHLEVSDNRFTLFAAQLALVNSRESGGPFGISPAKSACNQ